MASLDGALLFLHPNKGGVMITVFTTNQCAYCTMVKKFLTSKGKEYTVVNLEEEPETRQSLLEKTGAMTVPQTMIGNKIIVGWNPGMLAAALSEL